ncbi:LytR/AlgR family response regulator transcription factor [Anaeromicropila herbilytica]|uniref:DNA-binding response regulator n=1 Tax=Anaeromicropila herbilytica TaxID=2785025 RepID=A0A7R7EJJ6_9FIRM|nr:LytTR family DNA-binding domain-containing protein [Anaeromicropila herbilytica]BCN29967.1 DNA-binding response regulator [Anaeromicropila herbilytica]
MISMLICSGDEKEIKCIHFTSRELAAYLSDEKWDFNTFLDTKDIVSSLNHLPILDLICFDITLQDSIPIIEELRRKNKEAYIALIADNTISPMSYMKPSIMAASLLLRPLKNMQVRERLEELFQSLFKETNRKMNDDSFVFENREGQICIAYNRIRYFEAREKRVFVCTDNKEITFYETMDNLLTMLPDYFIRCHRSFIVNAKKIERVQLAQNTILLEDESILPISRSYRNNAKEYRKWK